MSEDETAAAEEGPPEAPVPKAPPEPEAATPEPETPAAVPEPEPPCKWFRVEFVAPGGMRTPIEAAGRWWGERSVHVLPERCAREIAAQPHFTLLNEVPMPANAQPCTGCRKTKVEETV